MKLLVLNIEESVLPQLLGNCEPNESVDNKVLDSLKEKSKIQSLENRITSLESRVSSLAVKNLRLPNNRGFF